MDSYTITIAPNNDSGAATRLVVDTSGDQVRITDVHLHAPQGLSSGHIPTVDFELLLQAVTGAVAPSSGHPTAGAAELGTPHGAPALEAATAGQSREEQGTPATPKSRARKAAVTPPARAARARTATALPAGETAAPRRSARPAATPTTRAAKQSPAKAGRARAKTTGKAATAKTPPTPARKRTAARAASPVNNPAPAKRTRAAATATAPSGGRVYRRTPDDLAAVVEQVGTVAGVAAHYQVPRHTAQGWVRRLRTTA